MTYREALARLYALEHSGIKLGLERIVGALKDLGHPEDGFASLHVAGTNGKGSTSAFLSGILQSCGVPVGLFTSPHITDFRERFRVDGRMVSEERILEGLDAVWPAVEANDLSFFEASTVLGFWIFVREGVRAAVLEVGLGGRLDATNVVSPDLTVITSLSLDHQKTLGSTLSRIAGEKAGIIKPGVPLILANGPYEARRVVLSTALEKGAPVLLDREALRVRVVRFDLTGTRWEASRRLPHLPYWLDGRWEISLVGAHQVENARLALLGAAALAERGWPLHPEGIAEGLRTTHWPGRMQWLGPDPPVLLDVAHNAEGALRLVAALRMLNVRPSVRWVVGMVQGKDHEAFLRTLVRAGRNVHLASPRNERSVSTRVLERAADAAGARRAVHGSVADAVTSALASLAPDEILVVTGSFFTMEEACEVLGVEPRRSLYDAMEAVP